MGDRIYTGAEALKLLDALCANRTPAPWSVGDRALTDDNYDVRVIKSADRDSVGHVWASAFDGDHDDIALKAVATLAAAAPDLAASVAHHAARADRAEAEVTSAVDRLVGLVGDRAPLAEMIRAVEDGIRTMEGEAVSRQIAHDATMRDLDNLRQRLVVMTAERDRTLSNYQDAVGVVARVARALGAGAAFTADELLARITKVMAERDALRASRHRWIDAAGPASHTLCPTCGVGVSVDEDGCCETCGGDAMGDYVDERREGIEAAETADRAAAALEVP